MASLMVVVGDVSADRHTAKILERLKEKRPDLHVFGAGGPHMRATGMEQLFKTEEFTVIGIFEVVRSLPFFYRMRQTLLKAIDERKPDAVLLVDSGGFNIQFATAVRKRNPNLPIYYFISPQIWASRPWRVLAIRKAVSKMLTVFPFEEPIYLKQKVPARFVGHYLMHDLPDVNSLPDREEFITSLGLDPKKPVIAVLPGSRRQEVKLHMPIVVQAMEALMKLRPDVQFIVSKATERVGPLVEEALRVRGLNALDGPNALEGPSATGKRLAIISGGSNFALYKNCDFIWAKSGTNTLEITLFGCPMLIFFKGNWFSYFIVMFFKTVKNVGWPNLLAGKLLVPELLQMDCRSELIVRYSLDFLDVPALGKEIREELLTLGKELGSGDFVENCTEELMALLKPASLTVKS